MNAKTKEANCRVLECDAASADYVKQSSPLDLKRRELKEADTDENPVRVREVNKRRIQKDQKVKAI